MHGNRGHLDGDPPLAFNRIAIEKLFLHLPLADGVGQFQHPVSQSRFAGIDVGNDRKVSNTIHGF